jgi:hypothetical protein
MEIQQEFIKKINNKKSYNILADKILRLQQIKNVRESQPPVR